LPNYARIKLAKELTNRQNNKLNKLALNMKNIQEKFKKSKVLIVRRI